MSPEAIRCYESRGLPGPPARDASGYRRSTEQALEQLRLIKAAQAFGFTLDEIGRILDRFRDGPAPCAPVREIVQQRLDTMDALIAWLSQLRNRLASAIDRAAKAPAAGRHTARRAAVRVAAVAAVLPRSIRGSALPGSQPGGYSGRRCGQPPPGLCLNVRIGGSRTFVVQLHGWTAAAGEPRQMDVVG